MHTQQHVYAVWQVVIANHSQAIIFKSALKLNCGIWLLLLWRRHCQYQWQQGPEKGTWMWQHHTWSFNSHRASYLTTELVVGKNSEAVLSVSTELVEQPCRMQRLWPCGTSTGYTTTTMWHLPGWLMVQASCLTPHKTPTAQTRPSIQTPCVA